MELSSNVESFVSSDGCSDLRGLPLGFLTVFEVIECLRGRPPLSILEVSTVLLKPDIVAFEL